MDAKQSQTTETPQAGFYNPTDRPLAAVYNPTEEELVIHETTDYDQFKHLDENRNLKEWHVLELMEAIKRKNLLSENPILVNKDKEVFDGQHRLEAARRLGVPVFWKYTYNMTSGDIAPMNAHNKQWGLEDYLETYVKQGLQQYIRVKHFLDENPEIALYSALGLLNGGTAQPGSELIKQFEAGHYKIKDLEHAKEVVKMLREYREVAPKVSRTKTFINAIAKLSKTDFFNHKRMLEKMQLAPAKVVKQTDVKGMIAMLEDLYNYRAKGDFVSFRKI